MPRTLDRYIGRAFLAPFVVTTAVIVGLYLVAHAFSNLDEFLALPMPVRSILFLMAKYYLARVPVFLVPVAPVALLVGAAYGIAVLARQNELMAMKACGVSLWRILTPIYALSVLLAGLAFANNELLVPRIEATYGTGLATLLGKDDLVAVPEYIEEEHTVFTLQYNPATKAITSVYVQIQDEPSGQVTKIKADKAARIPGGWKLTGNVEVNGEKAESHEWRTSLRERDVEASAVPVEEMPMRRLLRLLRHGNPEDAKRGLWRYHFHRRLAYPFTGIVLVMLGLPFVIGSERIHRARLLGVGVCVVLALVFFAAQIICQNMANNESLPPEIAAWLPCLLFGGLGIYLLETVHS